MGFDTQKLKRASESSKQVWNENVILTEINLQFENFG